MPVHHLKRILDPAEIETAVPFIEQFQVSQQGSQPCLAAFQPQSSDARLQLLL